MKFNYLEIELTDIEINLLKDIDWTDKNPKEPYGTSGTYFNATNSLCEKGIIQYIVSEWEGDYSLFLTDIGKQIINKLYD